MKFQGRIVDSVALWQNYVEFPHNMVPDGKYLPLVKCPNPEHDTEKRHFQINSEDGLVHCFAHCGISGTFSRAIAMIEGVDERKASKIIMRHKSRRVRIRKDTEPKTIVIPEFTTYLPQAALEYLAAREIDSSSISRFGLGWDAEELRIVIPAKDLNGITRFLIKRAIRPNDNPKYLYAPDGVSKNSLLFGACQTDPRMVRSFGVILVEGSIDAIRLHQHGFTTAVATLGTGISEIQSRVLARLRPRRVCLLFDRDVAGIHGIDIARRRLGKYPLYVGRYPKGKYDPAELERGEVDRILERAVPVSRFMASV